MRWRSILTNCCETVYSERGHRLWGDFFASSNAQFYSDTLIHCSSSQLRDLSNGCQDDISQQPSGERHLYDAARIRFCSKRLSAKLLQAAKVHYGLKHASRSWNIRFDQALKSFSFDQNPDDSCVYMKSEGGSAVFLVLYVDGILLIGSDRGTLSTVKVWLAKTFNMKDLGEANYIIWIKLHRDRKNRMIDLSQAVYIDNVLVRFAMQNSKKGITAFRHKVCISKDHCLKTT